ncbi:MAG: hypothetical protein PHI71_10570 [Acidiphilium sp.]|nr:hypothetical protein [Acidiphilium sp.]
MNSPPKIPPFDPLELTRRLNSAAGTRAPLVMWMIENHDELDRVLSLARVNWLAFAGYVTELGFLNARGKPLSPQNVRQCWGRAKKTHAAKSARLPPSKSSTPSSTPRPVDPVPAPPPAEPKFKFAKMRNGGRGVSPEELRELGDPSAPADPNDPRWCPQPGQKPK